MKHLGLLVLAITGGCASLQPMEIVSDPPGAKVDINSEYVGDTPLKLNVRPGWMIITATPAHPGECLQKKVIPPGSRVPQKVYFSMNLCPTAPAQSVEQTIQLKSQ